MFSKRQIPNTITAMRLLLVVPIAFCLYFESYRQALILFFIAGLSDGIDGYLARRFNWRTRFGAITDPLADKLLLITTFLVLTLNNQIFLWLTVLVFLRDIIIVSGALLYHYRVGSYEMSPTRLGKLNTLLQITYVLMVMLHLAGVTMPGFALTWTPWLVAAVTVMSGAHYVIMWGRKYFAERAQKRLDV